MPANYAEVLADLDAQIGFHESELETLRAARPAILKLSGVSAMSLPVHVSPPVMGRFTGMGTTAAVRELMKDGALRTREEAFDELRAGGWSSDAISPIGSLGATLSQMKDELEKVEDRWRKKTLVERVKLASLPQPPPSPPISFQQWERGLASSVPPPPPQQ